MGPTKDEEADTRGVGLGAGARLEKITMQFARQILQSGFFKAVDQLGLPVIFFFFNKVKLNTQGKHGTLGICRNFSNLYLAKCFK